MGEKIKTVKQLFRAVHKKHGSNAAMAHHLALSPQTVSRYGIGLAIPDDNVALQLAYEAQLPAEYVLAFFQAARARKVNQSHVAMIWNRVARRLRP